MIRNKKKKNNNNNKETKEGTTTTRSGGGYENEEGSRDDKVINMWSGEATANVVSTPCDADEIGRHGDAFLKIPWVLL